MKRLWTTLLIIAMAVVVTIPATAAPPNCKELPFENRHYCGLPPNSTTTTTTTTPPPTLEACPTETFPIPIPKTGWVDYECLWTPADPQLPGEAVEGNVTVASLGGISKLLVLVRDSAPGDVCLLAPVAPDQIIDGSFVGSFDLPCGNGTPLHLSVVFFAKKNASPVEVTLSVEPKIQEGQK
jgi:hypothetical protein